MAIASVGTLGTAAEGASSDSVLTLTTSAALNAGNVGVLSVVSDNAGATGNTNHHTSVTDSGSNTYTKIYEYTYSPGSVAADGVTVSVWVVRPASDLAASSTLTINQSANTAEKCATFWEFTAGAALQLAGTAQTSGGNQSHPASMSISSLTSKEYLFFRAVGKEINSTTVLTPTTNYTAIDGTRSRNNAAAVLIRGEFRILTGTGDTSSPTMNVVCDTGNIYVALEEVAAGTEYTQAVAGTVTPAGVVALRTGKFVAGAVTPDGALIRMTSKPLTGTITPDGGLLKRIGKIFAGTLTPDGALTAIKTALIALGGTLTPAGELLKRTEKAVAGTITPDGGLIKSIGKMLAGTVTPDGGLAKRISKALTGTLTSAGDLIATLTAAAAAVVGMIELHLPRFVVNAVRAYHDPAETSLPSEPVNPVQDYHDPAERTLRL